MSREAGRHFLQIPGPTNVPGRILRAIERPTIDHRGPDFGVLCQGILADLRRVFQTEQPVIVFPASGTGAWEAALVNTLSPGDRVLMFETGHFATLWSQMAGRLGLEVEFLDGDWRGGADPARIEARLAEDRERAIRAVAVVPAKTTMMIVRAAVRAVTTTTKLRVRAVVRAVMTKTTMHRVRVAVRARGTMKRIVRAAVAITHANIR